MRAPHRRLLTILAAVIAAVALFAPPAAAAPADQHGAPPANHTVEYDHYSIKVDGRRIYLWSGEFHYWRLPSPDLWRDVLQKMKAAGFTATSIYFHWGFHSPAPGVYDFTGVRDVERVLRIAEEVGLYVIARPGPYINAETDSGGFPGWLQTQAGRARSSAPDYTAAYREWLRHINPIIARHQLTNGTGSVLLYQVENEYGNNGDPVYMTQLQEQVRADGITVPIMHNYCCGPSTWATGPGSVQVPTRDSYPQGFNCSNPTQWRGVDALTRLRDDVPVFTAEYQGGAFDPWGGPGYESCRQLIGPDFEKVFYKNNVANGATAQNFYMTFGGTSWGWLPDPGVVYTSYDYGAAITEPRQLTAKYDELKRQGYFVSAVAPLTKTDPAGGAPVTEPAVLATTRVNPDDNTHFYVLRHRDSTSTATNDTHLTIDLGVDGTFSYDDADPALVYSGAGWQHASGQPWTAGDYRDTESFSPTAGDSVSVSFTGPSVRWMSSLDANHGIADVLLDGVKVATVDTYAATKQFQQVLYSADDLPTGQHTLTVVATGTRNPAASGTFVVVDAIDTPERAGEVYPSVPQEPGTAITLAGRDSKTLVAGYRLGAHRLQYATSEIMTHARIGDRDVALLYGRAGQAGETVLRYPAEPRVTVLSGSVQSTWDAGRGDLRLNYAHDGLAEVLVTPPDGVPLLLMLATDEVAAEFWRADTSAGPVLVRGPELVRTVHSGHAALRIAGDLAADTRIDVWAGPAAGRILTWNGIPVRTVPNPDGSVSSASPLRGPRPVTLPALTGWRYTTATPEADPAFDDGRWTLADKSTTNNPTKPAAPPVLYTDEYGFHYGDVWYRGRFTAAGTETGVALSAITGRAGVYSVWLNGTFLGSSGDTTHRFDFPAGSVRPGAENVLAVLVENMGHNQDFNADDSHKQPRGLTAATILGSTARLGWRIQGALGGERLVDPVRGGLNTGGQFGERNGYHLPGFPDRRWQPVTLPHPDTTPGTAWYRTTFELRLPPDQDVPIALRFTDDPARHYRALVYLNGWLIGRYINDVGPQRSFPLPAGLLRTDGRNTLAIAVWSTDATTGGLGQVTLEQIANHTTSLRVSDVDSPGYDPRTFLVPPSTARLSLHAPDEIQRGGTGIVSAILAAPNRGPELRDADLRLSIPDGWAATPIGPTHADRVPPGGLVKVAWQVTAPSGEQPGAAVFSATATYRVLGHPDRATATTTSALPIPPPTGINWVSDLPFTSTNGWGPVERDTSNGEALPGDGRPITLNGTVYAKGLGVHSPGAVTLNLGANCTRFTATVGVDDEVGNSGSVRFSVLGDGATLTETPTLTGSSPSIPLDVDITAIRQLDLIIADAADGNGLDHADWAEARLTCAT
ncbi:MAG TPA: beta-galactosidase [Actinophytocola sp.]|uniref:beta-galactosidase n=1 Tax=Actinophytocola sp. TaxID=1872138 RepID=UPI002DDDA258|nr:beta-galactosidase [Actinophytocola sp.]HEV2779938.1 beta-galactosidase [Actinophytocola sp.]